jgi:hypothetical protein
MTPPTLHAMVVDSFVAYLEALGWRRVMVRSTDEIFRMTPPFAFRDRSDIVGRADAATLRRFQPRLVVVSERGREYVDDFQRMLFHRRQRRRRNRLGGRR